MISSSTKQDTAKAKPPTNRPYEIGQKLSQDGRIIVGRKGWAVRTISLVGHLIIIAYFVYEGISTWNTFILLSILLPLTNFITLYIGWTLYRNPGKSGQKSNELVSVVIPVYNQKSMIRPVIDLVYESTYKNLEVIAVNDGSTDGTREVLDELIRSNRYQNLKVVHQKNRGKRSAIASGFFASGGCYVVFVDSDSIVDRNAIAEFVKAFESDPAIGGVVGHVKALNPGENFLTKCQDAWYDFSYNIMRTCESYLNNVTILSGCLAAYRRVAIEDFVSYWAESPKNRFGTDRELTAYAISPASTKTELHRVFGNKPWVATSQKLMDSMARFDDAEDRALTARSLISWKSAYVASAIGFTEVPNTLRQFAKQQIRWKKGYMRANFFVSSYFWKKPPLVAFLFYIHFMTALITPLANFGTFFYIPFVVGNWLWPITVVGLAFATGIVEGLDYKNRDPRARYWIYKPFSAMLNNLLISWLLFAAIIDYRSNKWKTR